jgi:hypothetical protein
LFGSELAARFRRCKRRRRRRCLDVHGVSLRTAAGRILLVGSAYHDSVIDSYRRALLPHYDVRVFDPFEGFPGIERLLGRIWAGRANVALRLANSVVLREPLATSERRLLRAAADFARIWCW